MFKHSARWASASLLAVSIVGCSGGGSGQDGDELVTTNNAILFVTQVPIPADFATIASTFANQSGSMRSCARGGDLWIRYPDGTLRNLTQEAGYGSSGFQGATSIAVREPCVYWSGNKAVFSMVVGAPAQYDNSPFFWQLYEIDGLQPDDTPLITKVPFQPADANNTGPCYASDGRILYASDRPRDGASHLYPQRDEYEEQPTNTGLWSLDPATGALFLMNHTPSGAFSPRVDSFGRVTFTRWDHLERDQQADDEVIDGENYGTFNYSDESAQALAMPSNAEVFPEPRVQWIDFVNGTPGYSGASRGWASYLVGNTFNSFLPWQINQDGTEEETINHVGRHELAGYFNESRKDDPNIISFLDPTPFTANQRPIENMLQIREDPNHAGTYFATDAPEFFSHGAGQVIRMHGPVGMSPDQMSVDYITHRETQSISDHPTSNHSGHYRNPLPLTDGQWIAAHTKTTTGDEDTGTYGHPKSLYDFRLKKLVASGDYFKAGATLTQGIEKTVTYYNPDQLITYSGKLWELDPVEVVARPVPPAPAPVLGAPEQQALDEENVTLAALRQYLTDNDLALVVSRNVTTRDRNDQQQPFNLRIAGSLTQTLGTGGTIYDVSHLQFFQGDQLRGLTFGNPDVAPGRRVIAQTMHATNVDNPPNHGGPAGSVALGNDGSMAATVPARRAISWQLTDPSGEAVVRERYWITFQPGEIRTCGSCHGLSTADQANQPPPTNKPQALNTLLQYLQQQGSL